MAYTITTEAARVALARREYEQSAAEIEREMEARASVLKHDPRATDLKSFQKLCAADPELRELAIDAECAAVWRDGVIADNCVATIEDGGEFRWTLPQYANNQHSKH